MSANEESITCKKEMLTLIKENANNLSRGSFKLKDEPEVVVAAMIKDRWALKHASSRLQQEPMLKEALFMHRKQQRTAHCKNYLEKVKSDNETNFNSSANTLFQVHKTVEEAPKKERNQGIKNFST